MTIPEVRALLAEDFNKVDALIYEKIQSEVSLIDELAGHIIQSGGKRLRPMMLLLVAKACGYQGDNHVTLAASVEFLHTATLLHDDVIDESKLRRGRETANEIWGSKVSILVGDFLLTQYMQLLIEAKDLRIMKLLGDIAYQIGCGEIEQLDNRHKPEISEKTYFKVIRSKTSLLFAASACIAAMLSNVDEETEKALFQYGLHLGNAFQLIDDALDYCSDSNTIGKNIGDDLADGIATLPLIHALKHGTMAQQEKIKLSLEKGTLDYLDDVKIAILETNAIEHTKKTAAIEADKAINSLQVLKPSQYKDALIALAHYAVTRDH